MEESARGRGCGQRFNQFVEKGAEVYAKDKSHRDRSHAIAEKFSRQGADRVL